MFSLQRMSHDALIFDLDGTLVDSLPGIAEALNSALVGAGYPPHAEAAVRGFVGDGLETTVKRACPEVTDDAVVARLVEDFRLVYEEVWKSGTTPYPGIRELLMEFHAQGVPMAVLSNKSHAFTVEMVAGVFPEISFAAILGLRPGMPPKPDPGGALEIAAKLGIEPPRWCVIGDSTMDIETARRAGMRSCAVGWGYHDQARLEAADPEGMVAHPDELRNWIRGWVF